jgi:ABC-type dipeptide/oligopeptide/nickel transport system permease component
MVTPDTLTIWLKEQAWPIAIIVGLVVFAFIVIKISASRRHQALAREREGVTESTFASHLQRYGFDPAVAAATYRYLQERQLVKFPILDSEDINQTVREMTSSLGRHFNPGLLHKPLVTVEDLVRMLQASPRRVSVAA